ncbi:hypothetical protein DPMN_026808 [Dreissena polymorpha]|uniref:Uncharacterized protein n=1 Tax=Dreissena polymorpha TaxID=45954 RepID=A0A9D4LU47_DREPO|nr:hypothetical protein DPMN_026808 [Dreissena polymorpha]
MAMIEDTTERNLDVEKEIDRLVMMTRTATLHEETWIAFQSRRHTSGKKLLPNRQSRRVAHSELPRRTLVPPYHLQLLGRRRVTIRGGRNPSAGNQNRTRKTNNAEKGAANPSCKCLNQMNSLYFAIDPFKNKQKLIRARSHVTSRIPERG